MSLNIILTSKLRCYKLTIIHLQIQVIDVASIQIYKEFYYHYILEILASSIFKMICQLHVSVSCGIHVLYPYQCNKLVMDLSFLSIEIGGKVRLKFMESNKR